MSRGLAHQTLSTPLSDGLSLTQNRTQPGRKEPIRGRAHWTALGIIFCFHLNSNTTFIL